MKSETVKNKTKTNLSTWRKVSLIDCIDLIGGGTPKTSVTEYWDGNIPWLSVKDFNNDNRYVYTTEKHISEKGLANSSTKLLQKDDIIISARGTVGELAMIPFPMAFNQSCYGIRAKAGINKTFLYYLLKNIIKQLKAVAHGSVFDTITRDTFSNIFVNIPDEGSQGYIASILSAFDDKIALNNKINENLEQQAQALYREMFLENQNITTVTKTLNSIAVITMGQSPSGKSYNEDGIGEVFYQGRAEFGTRFPTRRLFTTEPKRMAEAGDVLLSVRAPVGDLNVAYEKCCIGRGLAAVHSKIGNNSFILYTMMASKPRFDVFNGEGTVFGSINRESLNTMPIEVPPMEMIVKFEDMAHPIDEMIRIRYEENCRLETLRDTLLPKLMNGEIDIEDVI